MNINDALAKYIDAERISRQSEIARHLREILSEAQTHRVARQQSLEISRGERKSNDFLSRRLLERF